VWSLVEHLFTVHKMPKEFIVRPSCRWHGLQMSTRSGPLDEHSSSEGGIGLLFAKGPKGLDPLLSTKYYIFGPLNLHLLSLQLYYFMMFS
jgi:hypothetical protein